MNEPIDHLPSTPMNPITLLARSGVADLTPEEDAMLNRELAAAYRMDEASATSSDVQRIAEKVRARLDNPPTDSTPHSHNTDIPIPTNNK